MTAFHRVVRHASYQPSAKRVSPAQGFARQESSRPAPRTVDAMKVTERLRRDGDLLFYTFTVDDPNVLAEPWTQDTYVRRLNADPKARVDEAQPCIEQDLKFIVDKYYRG